MAMTLALAIAMAKAMALALALDKATAMAKANQAFSDNLQTYPAIFRQFPTILQPLV